MMNCTAKVTRSRRPLCRDVIWIGLWLKEWDGFWCKGILCIILWLRFFPFPTKDIIFFSSSLSTQEVATCRVLTSKLDCAMYQQPLSANPIAMGASIGHSLRDIAEDLHRAQLSPTLVSVLFSFLAHARVAQWSTQSAYLAFLQLKVNWLVWVVRWKQPTVDESPRSEVGGSASATAESRTRMWFSNSMA